MLQNTACHKINAEVGNGSSYLEKIQICAVCWGRELGMSSVAQAGIREGTRWVSVIHESHSKESLSSSVSKRALYFMVF